MKFPFFTGERTKPEPNLRNSLPVPRIHERTKPEDYIAEHGLVYAFNTALLMSQPLLLTGEPGTGKSLFAYRAAWELGFDEPLKFETKSTSTATDLFYHYNHLAHFHAAHSNNNTLKDKDFITFNALGEAILRANKTDKIKKLLPDNHEHQEPCRSIVLIDEIDKAPRDFPNDILNEIENMYFKIPELGNMKVEVEPEMSPIVIITSNSEKHLPDAFLRRCAYYHLGFPDEARLRQILDKKMASIKPLYNDIKIDMEAFLEDALRFFLELRAPNSDIKKKPATAELIAWLEALREITDSRNPMNKKNIEATLGILIKSAEDLVPAKQVVEKWS